MLLAMAAFLRLFGIYTDDNRVDEATGLTERQKRLVQNTWAVIRKDEVGSGVAVMSAMARLTAVKDSLDKALHDESKVWTKYFTKIEKQTGVDRTYVFLGSAVVLGIYLVFGVGQQLICNIFGFIYPAYCSMKALESPKKEDDTKWLTYWVVFAVFTIVEYFSDLILCWFPVYWLFKCLFYMWLMVPMENNGSMVLYRSTIRPLFLRHHQKVDKLLSEAQSAAVKVASNALLTEKQD